jgi:CheY-like chemotaxis protein
MRPKAGPTILVADDFEDMRSMLRLWLERRGYQVVEALDGESAIEVARERHPDLILMDIDMPERSGISATYKIRKDPDLIDIPIVAITGYETDDLQQDALKAGCIECLTKPVDTIHLGKLLSRLI